MFETENNLCKTKEGTHPSPHLPAPSLDPELGSVVQRFYFSASGFDKTLTV